jgi:hypothetical protein
MPVTRLQSSQKPDFWWAFGHSWLENQLGSRNQTGRPDGMFRAANDIEFNNWRNFAVTGSRIIQQGVAQGGYSRLFQSVPKVSFGAPYVSQDGGLILCWGINDMGKSGPGVTYMNAFIDALRSCVVRWRAGSLRENTDASIAWGAGFGLSSGSDEWTSGSSYRTATTTTSATFTITIPADYTGTPISIVYNGIVNGGTVTYSGTAGVTGTFSTSAIIPAGEVSHCPRTHRIKTLTAANAGQTIIGTVTQMDASGSVDFDCYIIEAENSPPVILCDIARFNTLGYSGFPQLSGNTVAVNDASVQTWNTAIYNLAAEFDPMVQVAYFDAAINKDASKLWSVDGVHPNEKGSAVLADALLDAQRRFRPSATTVTSPPTGITASINPPSPREGALVRHHVTGLNRWYTAEFFGGYGTAYTPVAGDMWAIPVQVTVSNARVSMFGVDQVAAGTATGTIRWGLYDDPGGTGYPFSLMHELTASSGAFTLTLATGIKTSPAPTASGSIDKPLDPGLFWLCLKIITAGTGITLRTLLGPNLIVSPVNHSTGAALSATTYGMGYKLTGQGTTVLPGRYPTTATQSDACPMVSFRLT